MEITDEFPFVFACCRCGSCSMVKDVNECGRCPPGTPNHRPDLYCPCGQKRDRCGDCNVPGSAQWDQSTCQVSSILLKYHAYYSSTIHTTQVSSILPKIKWKDECLGCVKIYITTVVLHWGGRGTKGHRSHRGYPTYFVWGGGQEGVAGPPPTYLTMFLPPPNEQNHTHEWNYSLPSYFVRGEWNLARWWQTQAKWHYKLTLRASLRAIHQSTTNFILNHVFFIIADCAVGAGVVRPPVGIVGASCSEHRVHIEIISPGVTVTSVTAVTLIAEDGTVRILKWWITTCGTFTLIGTETDTKNNTENVTIVSVSVTFFSVSISVLVRVITPSTLADPRRGGAGGRGTRAPSTKICLFSCIF